MRPQILLVLLLMLGCWQTADAASGREITLKRLVRAMDLAGTDPSAALAELDALAQRTSVRSDLYEVILQERVNLLLQEGENQVARAELEAVLAERGAAFAPRLRLLLAQVMIFQDEIAAAVAQLETWRAQLAEPDPEGLFMLGFGYVQVERFEEAASVIELAVAAREVVPRPQWLELLAYTYTRLGQSERAIALLEGLIARYPDSTRWWRQLASNHLLEEQLQRGTAALSVAELLEASAYVDARRLARLHAAAGMPADGADILARAIDAHSEPVEFEDRMLLGEMWMLARDFDTAVAAFEMASAMSVSGEPDLMVGQLHVMREDYAAARSALRRAVAGYGDEAPPPRAWYLLAIVEVNLGDLDEALRVLEPLADHPSYAARGERLIASIEQMRR